MKKINALAITTILIAGFALKAKATDYTPNLGPLTSGYQGKVFDFAALEGIITANSVSTLDQLIPLLPDNYKKHYALMAKSGSLQSASPDSPRVIAYGNYQTQEGIYPGQNLDRLYLGFQTDQSPTSKLPNTLEAIEWSPETKSYQFYQIEFPITAKSITKNPTTCMQCHGTPLRPNWTAYPRWDGSIGNNNQLDGIYDYLGHQPDPNEANQKLSAIKNANSRLKEFDLGEFFEIKLENPSANLSQKIGDQLSFRDLSLMQSRADYAPFKFALAGAMLGCENVSDFFSSDLYAKLQTGVYQSLSLSPKTEKNSLLHKPQDLTYQNVLALTEALVQRSSKFGAGFEVNAEIATWLRFIYEGQGKPDVLKNILGTPPTDPSDPTWSYDLVGFGQRFEEMRSQFFKSPNIDQEYGIQDFFNLSLQASYWQINQYYKTNPQNAIGPYHEASDPSVAACQTLASKSREASANFSPSVPATATLTASALSADPANGSGDVLSDFRQYCMECHNSATKHPLPLTDLGLLKTYRTDEGVTIAERLINKEMPYPTAPQPSDAVRKAMIDALQ